MEVARQIDRVRGLRLALGGGGGRRVPVWRRALLGAASLCLLAGMHAAHASGEPQVELAHYWVSPGERNALSILRDAFVAAGGVWHETASPDYTLMKRDVVSRVAVGLQPSAMWWGTEDRSISKMLDFLLRVDSVAPPDWSRALEPVALDVIGDDPSKALQLPLIIHNENWAWFNARVFRKHRLPLPQTWDEVLRQAPLLAAAGITPVAASDQPWTIRLLLTTMILGIGGEEVYKRLFVSADPAVFADPRMQSALKTFLALRHWGPAPGTAKTWDEAVAMVRSGRAAMTVMGDWAVGELPGVGTSRHLDLVCTQPPDSAGRFIAAVDMFAFPKEGVNLQGQQLLARIATTPAVQLRFANAKGATPAIRGYSPADLHPCEREALPILRAGRGTVLAPRSTLAEGQLVRWMNVAFKHWRSRDSTLADLTRDMRVAVLPHVSD